MCARALDAKWNQMKNKINKLRYAHDFKKSGCHLLHFRCDQLLWMRAHKPLWSDYINKHEKSTSRYSDSNIRPIKAPGRHTLYMCSYLFHLTWSREIVSPLIFRSTCQSKSACCISSYANYNLQRLFSLLIFVSDFSVSCFILKNDHFPYRTRCFLCTIIPWCGFSFFFVSCFINLRWYVWISGYVIPLKSGPGAPTSTKKK